MNSWFAARQGREAFDHPLIVMKRTLEVHNPMRMERADFKRGLIVCLHTGSHDGSVPRHPMRRHATSAAKTARTENAVEGADKTVATRSVMRFDLLPREQRQGSVRFLTGGIGLREAIAIKHAMHQFPLTLEFRMKASGKEQFLEGVPITIRVLTGQVVLKTLSAGPFLLARLRPGKYEVIAEQHGRMQRREVEIRANGGERLVFEWNIA